MAANAASEEYHVKHLVEIILGIAWEKVLSLMYAPLSPSLSPSDEDSSGAPKVTFRWPLRPNIPL